MKPPGHRRKHSAIDEVHEQQIIAWIQKSAETSTPVTKTEIKDYCTREFQVAVTRGWVNSFVLRHALEIIPTKSSPQEEQRLQVPRVFLDRAIQELNEHVKRCIAELVFNLDEVGISD
jgi:transposase